MLGVVGPDEHRGERLAGLDVRRQLQQGARRGGHVVLVGNLAPKIDFPLQAVVTRELTLHGTCGSAGEYPLCLDLIARGVIRVEPMISAVAPLADGAAWFEKLSAKDGSKFMKVILTP